MQCAQSPQWIAAENEEYLSLINNNTWSLVPRPKNVKVLPCFWLYTIKCDKYGLIIRYKARLVIMGNLQYIDYDFDSYEFTAPVINQSPIKLLFAIAVNFKYKLRHIDVKTAYLHADLNEEVFMMQPPGYELDRYLVCRLNKSIYGLKSSALNWYNTLRNIFLDLGFQCCLIRQLYFLFKWYYHWYLCR